MNHLSAQLSYGIIVGFGYGVSRYYAVGNSWLFAYMDEADSQHPVWCSGSKTYSNLRVLVVSNGLADASTCRFRKNSANGNQVISVPATTTGEFLDAVNSDSVVMDDLINYSYLYPYGGTNSLKINAISTLCNSSVATSTRMISSGIVNFSYASVTYYQVPCGYLPGGWWGSNGVCVKAKKPGVLRDLFVGLPVNPRTTAMTVGIYIGGVSAVSVSIAGGATGNFEDSVNTDTVDVDDLVGIYCTSGAGTETAGFNYISMLWQSAAGDFPTWNVSSAGNVALFGTTYYPGMTGSMEDTGAGGLESEAQCTLGLATTSSNLQTNNYVNNLDGATTVRTRVDGANGNQSVSIPAGTTGYYADTVNTDVLTATSKVNYQIVTGGTSSFIRILYICTYNNTPSSVGRELRKTGLWLRSQVARFRTKDT